MTDETPQKRAYKKRAPKVSEDDLIEVEALKRHGLAEDGQMAEIGDKNFISRKSARALQDAKAVKVVL